MRSTSARLTLLFGSLSGILPAVLGARLYVWVEKGFGEARGGEIQVESAPEVGTIFTLSFPVAADVNS